MTRQLPGWRPEFDSVFTVKRPHILGRVIEQNRHHYRVATENGPIDGEIAGRLLYKSDSLAQLPTVGDWVEIDMLRNEKKGVVRSIFPRYSKLSRKVVGKRSDEQVLVANIDQVMVVQSADSTFNVRRVERFAVVAKECATQVAIILSKIDLVDDPSPMIAALNSACPGMPILTCSCEHKIGIDAIRTWVTPGHTAVVIGPSGVGKSTLINQLTYSELLKTQAVSERHFKGTHTTTKRQLIEMQGGGILIDTPGLRELQLWDADDGIQETFDDITALAVQCQYSNCSHQKNRGCAVLQSVQDGLLSPDRLEHYIKLQGETSRMATNLHRLKDERRKKHLTQAKKGYNIPTRDADNSDE